MPPVDCHPAVTAASRRALLGPGDAGLFNLVLQGGTLHFQAGCGTLPTASTWPEHQSFADQPLRSVL